MKKIVCIIAAIAMISVFACSCGSTEGKPEAAPKSSSTVSNNSSSSGGSNSTYTSFSDYVASDTFQSEIESAKSMFKDTFEIEAFAEGNTLVYQYTYVNQLSDAQVEQVQTGMDRDNLKSGAKAVLKPMKQYFDAPDLGVSYRYYNHDGSKIAQIDFDLSVLDE